MKEIKFITVTMRISPHIGEASIPALASDAIRSKIENVWHIKFDRDIFQIIQTPTFQFSSTSLNVAVTKVADLVSRHPENYFCEINIK